MKKINLVTLGIISFSALTLGTPAVFADETTPEAGTEATVLFNPDDEGPIVVIPPEGGEEGEVDENGSDGNIGDGAKSFNIAYVSNFRFNDRADDDNDFTKFKPIKLNGNGMTLWAKGTQLTLNHKDETTSEYKNIPNFIQVVDNRGKLNGWNVSVSATPFSGKNQAGDTATLTGAVLSLNDGKIKGPEGIPAPTFFSGADSMAINTTATTLMSAAKGAGIGNWSLDFGQSERKTEAYDTLVENTGVKLVIPASAKPQADVAYKSTLSWVLTDGPASE